MKNHLREIVFTIWMFLSVIFLFTNSISYGECLIALCILTGFYWNNK